MGMTGPREQKVFTTVNNLLSSNSVLTHFDKLKPLTLAYDASLYRISVILSHLMLDGQKNPVAYFSRTLSSTEFKYVQISKEVFAILNGGKEVL